MGGLVVWSLATAASGLASSFAQLFVARVAVGAGESVNGPTAYSMVADSFPRQRLPRAVAISSRHGRRKRTVAAARRRDHRLVATLGSPDLPLVGVLRPWQVVLLGVGLPGLVISC